MIMARRAIPANRRRRGQPENATTRRLRTLLTVATAVLGAALATAARPAPQESAAVTRLQQEVASLKFRLDYDTGRLERSIQDLQRRLQAAEMRTATPGTVAAPLPAPTVGDDIEAHRLVVTDPQGRARAAFAYSDMFGPTVALMTPTGDVAAMLSASLTGPRLELYDGAVRLRASLGLDTDGVHLRLFDEGGDVVGELGTTAR